MSEIKMGFYDVYIYKFSEELNRDWMRLKLDTMRDVATVDIRDISDNGTDEKLKIVTSVIKAERFRHYEAGKEKYLNVTLFKMTAKNYWAVISFCKDGSDIININEIFQALFDTDKVHCYIHSSSSDDCEQFWARSLAKIPLVSRKDDNDKYQYDRMEEFVIKIEDLNAYSKLLDTKPSKLRAILAYSLGQIMGFISDSNGVIGEDIRENGKLSRVPFYVPCGRAKETIDKLCEFMAGAEHYDNYSYQQINANSSFDLSELTSFSQIFLYEKQFYSYFKNLKVDQLYKINAIAMSDTPIAVAFFAEAKFIKTIYFYDPGYFRNYDVQGINEAVTAMVNDCIKGVIPTINLEKCICKPNGADNRLLDAKISCLRAVNLYKNYSDVEIVRVADKASVVGGVCQQCIINEGFECDKVYLIVKGKIEIFGHDSADVQKPLMILKEREVFSIESLLTDKKASFSYRVYSDGAILLAIKPDDFMKEAALHGEIMKELLEIQTKRLTKFERLWVMT